MDRLNALRQVLNTASEIRDLTRTQQRYHFNTHGPVVFHLAAENCEVRVLRWQQRRIEVLVQLQAAFGWRVAHDQDEVGVYFVAQRRAVVGGMASALFELIVPEDTHLTLKLKQGRVTLEGVDGTLELSPPDTAGGHVDKLLPPPPPT